MKKLHKISIVFLLALLCLVAFVGCNTGLPTDDSGLKEKGFVFRVTFRGDGGRSANSSEILVYLKDGSGIPTDGTSEIEEFVRAGYKHTDWEYEIEGEDGMPQMVPWDFKRDRISATHPGVEWNEAEGLYELILHPNWQKDLAYEIVCIADDGSQHMIVRTITANSRYSTEGFDAYFTQREWPNHTFLPHFDENGDRINTGYYYDENCTREILSYSELSPSGGAYPALDENGAPIEGEEHFRIYTKWLGGDFAFVSDADDFTWNKANYYFLKDIDFTGLEYTMPTSAFTGKMIGNGHTIKGINATVDMGVSQSSVGLFGNLSGAVISDLTLEDCTLNINVSLNNSIPPHTIGLVAASVTNSTINGLRILNGIINIANTSESGGTVDSVLYRSNEKYFGAFDTVTGGVINGFTADISIYDPDGLGR